MSSPKKHIVLLGDSTLDNIIWLKGYEECVKYKLSKYLGENVKISNYAADGFTTGNMLEGGFPALSYSQRLHVDPYPCELVNFKPLEHIKELHSRDPVTDIVLSVGGNDIRVVLKSIHKLFVSMHEFVKNYQRILEECLEITPRVVIMMQYRPALYQDDVYGIYHSITMGSGDGIDKINLLMQTMYPQLLKMAEIYALPIIDLPNTFDPRFSDLFRSQIEPSALGSSLIGKMISHVFKNHSWDNSHLYSCSPGNYQKGDGTELELHQIDACLNSGKSWVIKPLPEFGNDIIESWAQYGEEFESVDEEDLEVNFSTQLKLLEEMGYNSKQCLALLESTNGM